MLERSCVVFHGMSLAVCLAALCAAGPAVAQPEEGFDRFFEAGTLRIDYHHFGNNKEETLAIDAVLREGDWPGPRNGLTAFPDFGKYRAVVLDQASGKPIFEYGYSSLFGEWQTTPEATLTRRVFHETVRLPMPRAPVILRILSRDNRGRLVKVFEETVDPHTHLVGATPGQRKDVTTLLLADAGPIDSTLDVVILADGYPAHQQEKAARDLARFARVMIETPPFDRYKDRLSIRGVIPVADLCGPDEPRKSLHRNPPLRTTFNTFDSARYLTTSDNRTLRDLASLVPYDAIVVVVNTSRYGGAGIFNMFSIFISDNEYDEYVMMHEFGHGFGGLGDEYYTSSVAYSDFYPRGVEPWEPNVTALLHGPSKVKWGSQIEPGVPVPTPPVPEYSARTGVFEGAGYSAKGLYRPALDCKMFSKKEIDYCAVCARAVEQMIRYYTE
ncbi:MAG: peptidase M64 [Deltaproteobacteria bacterium]|nr:peptidase M64 [Deltaproteobacteria bacterium]